MNKPFSRRSFLSGVAATSIVPFVSPIGAAEGRAQESSSSPYLVSPEWLASQIERAEPNLLVIDLSDLRPYRSDHIPGAIHSWWMETVERDYPYFGTVLDQKALDGDVDDQGKRRDWFERHGIGPDTHVVAYDRNHGQRAARIVWFLRFLGHEHASVLNGGFGGWQRLSLATSSGEEAPTALSVEPSITPGDGFYLATSRMSELLEAGEIDPVDIRTAAERLDTIDGQFETGLIPGSVHLPWDNPALSLTQIPDGFEPSIATTVLEDAGIRSDRRIVLYGRFGSDANQMWVVLKACGYPSVEIYDRGWVEWSDSGLSSLPVS